MIAFPTTAAVGAAAAADLCQGVPAQLQDLQDKLRSLQTAVDAIQNTVNGLTTNTSNTVTTLSRLAPIVDGIKANVGAINDNVVICSAPDLLALPVPGVAGPLGFCRLNGDHTKLQVQVYNQGSAETDTAGTVTRVVFTTLNGPVQLPSPDAVNTPPLAAGGSQLVEFAIPDNCSGATVGTCEFSIGVDATDAVAESNEANNNVAGSCGLAILKGHWCCASCAKNQATGALECTGCAAGHCTIPGSG